MDKRSSNRRTATGLSNAELETMSKQIFDEVLDELVLGVAFDVHRSVKTGLFAILETDSQNKSKSMEVDANLNQTTNLGVDIYGQVVQTMMGVPALKKQPECVCPNCQRNLAASRFAPHLEKCMGMGRNSSRLASRRIAKTGQEVTSYRESGMDEDEDDDEWVEPTKLSTNNRRRHRDKNSPRRQKNSHHSKHAAGSYPTSGKGDIYLVSGPDGTVTPPSSYDMLSMEERSNLLASMCGVITTGAKKICTRSLRCPIHTDAQRREIRMRWLSNDDDVDIDSFTEGDTVALRESLAQLSGASSPAESVVSTSSNPSATSSIRGGRREKARRGKKKGHSGSSKSASRGSTPPLLAD